jgi:hypothetical protein
MRLRSTGWQQGNSYSQRLIHSSQLFRWRQQLCERSQVPAAFNPVAITAEPEAEPLPAVGERAGVIEIEFATGGRMRITGPVDAPTVAVLMKGRERCSRCRICSARYGDQLGAGRERPATQRAIVTTLANVEFALK